MNLQHAASFALVVALLGCGSDVQTQGGGGSGTGAGDTGGVSANGGNTSSVGANGTGASGTGGTGNNTTVTTGGGTPQTACEQLCGNVTTCFGLDCSQAGVDCTNPQFDCPAECLKDASCADLGAIVQGNVPPAYAPCLQMCQGGMGGGGTGGGAPGGCQQCAFGANCLNACLGDASCQAWAQCAQNCQDPACFSMCNAANPNAAMQYGAVYSCMCTSCEMECAAQVDPCNQM